MLRGNCSRGILASPSRIQVYNTVCSMGLVVPNLGTKVFEMLKMRYFLIDKQKSLAVANIARDDPPLFPEMTPPLFPACTATTIRGKCGSEFET